MTDSMINEAEIWVAKTCGSQMEFLFNPLIFSWDSQNAADGKFFPNSYKLFVILISLKDLLRNF